MFGAASLDGGECESLREPEMRSFWANCVLRDHTVSDMPLGSENRTSREREPAFIQTGTTGASIALTAVVVVEG